MIGERSWCNYLGSTNRTTLMRELSMANVVVLPSFEDNCPMVILEAKAAGVPVAASRIGGIPDLIQHGQTGLLFDPNDSSQIEEAIRRILSDRLFAAQLSENARIEASKRFDPRVIAKQHVEIYQEVLN